MFKHIFLSIMHTTTSNKLVYPSPHFSVPWINDSRLFHIKFRNSLYRSAKRTGSLSLRSYYRYFRDHTLSLLRSLKSRFFQSLYNSHSFWSAVNKICKKPVSVPTLLFNGIYSPPHLKLKLISWMSISPLALTNLVLLYQQLLPLLSHLLFLLICFALLMTFFILFLIFL